MIPILRSIQVGLPKTYGHPDAEDPMDREWRTSFFKEPVHGRVAVHAEHLDGDGSADRIHHGGADKAILAYAAGHYPGWQQELQQDFPPGAFGENFTIEGLTEETVCIGDRFRIGDVIVEVSQPRQPCWKLARRWRIKDLPARVVMTGRSGWYLRVCQTGTIEPGWKLERIDQPHPEWSIALANRVYHHMKGDRVIAGELAAVPALSQSWKDDLMKRTQG